MKVIPTIYNGIEYRSRTEARWAVFMDAAECPFLYEPEGFDLGEHGFYIPDFYLPLCDLFVEIKPSIPVPGRSSPTEEFAKITKKPIVTFCGPPFFVDTSYEDSWQEQGYIDFEEGSDMSYWFCCCPHCGRVGIEFNGRSDRIKCGCPKSPHGDKGYNSADPILQRACFEANNAFRYGKK
jgi:hypothetical protein